MIFPKSPADYFLQDDELEWIEELEVLEHDHLMHTWQDAEIQTISWQMVKAATLSDPVLSQLKAMLEDGVDTDTRLLPEALKPFSRHWDSLWIQDDVIYS